MNVLPDPLHPAIVHFPVVLILFGALGAVIAVFWRKHDVPLLAGLLLGCGALGAWVALETGQSDGGLLETLSPQAEALLESHENWAERTLVLSAVAAAAALGAAGLVRFPRTARVLAIAAALTAVIASYAVYETGHRGGALVFRHSAGVNVASPTAPASSPAATAPERREYADRD